MLPRSRGGETVLITARRRLSERSLRAPTHLPRQRAESHPFEDKLDPEQHTEQPDCCRGEVGQKIERQQYSNNAACEDPPPVRKWPYRERKK